MTVPIVISFATLAFLLILFLVIVNSINNIINLILKIEYLLQRELEYRKEEREIARVFEEKTGDEKKQV